KVLAGTYTIRAHRDGYRDGDGVVRCEPVAGTCTWLDDGDPGTDPNVLTLTELSSLQVAATEGGATVAGAQYTLTTDGGSPRTLVGDAAGGGVTFTGLDPIGH